MPGLHLPRPPHQFSLRLWLVCLVVLLASHQRNATLLLPGDTVCSHSWLCG